MTTYPTGPEHNRDHTDHTDDLDVLLGRAHESLIEDLATILDLDAGVEQATESSVHTAFTDDLRTVLDLDRGLSTLTGGQPLPDSNRTEPIFLPRPGDLDDLGSLRRRSAPERLALRVTPTFRHLRALVRCASVVAGFPRVLSVRAGDLTLALALALALARAHDLAHDLALALDRTRALDRHRDRDRDLALALDRTRALAQDVVLDLRTVLDLDRDLARAVDLDRTLDLDRAHDIDRALDRAVDLGLDHGHEEALDRAGDHAAALLRALDRANALDLVHDGDRAVYLARFLKHALDRLARLDRTGDLAGALDALNPLAPAVALASIAGALRRNIKEAAGQAGLRLDLDGEPGERFDELDHALSELTDDFIGADLRTARLPSATTIADLAGVQWSDSTTWPPGWAEAIHAASTQIQSGMYEVTGDPGGRHHTAGAPTRP